MHNSMDLPFHLLETITNGFSEAQKVGHGGYADVYRAVHNGEEIAVKRLRPFQELDDREFDNEFRNLNNVQHQNIVRLVGYCYESRYKYVEHEGQLKRAEETERVLCFEYMQGGSLEKHIRDESCGLDWPTCYKIIRGTCEGLNHLHNAQKKPIYHLDIKPGNILLDENMTPKIADLGLSRLLATTQTYRTVIIKGTRGYMPPEYLDHGEISKKFDVFSLGVVIIKIMAGNLCSSSCYGMPPQQFIELVIYNWSQRLQGTSRYSSHEIDILRMKACVEIALRCVEDDRNKRPAIKDIVHELDELEAEIKMSLFSDQSKDRTGQKQDDDGEKEKPTAEADKKEEKPAEDGGNKKSEEQADEAAAKDDTKAAAAEDKQKEKEELAKPEEGVVVVDWFQPEEMMQPMLYWPAPAPRLFSDENPNACVIS